jgi:hypothetical protein
VQCCKKLLRCCERECSMLRAVVRATSNERSLHRCCEFVCGMLRAAGFATFDVSEKCPGAHGLSSSPGSWLSRGGGGVWARPPKLRSAHREEWVWRISSRESSAPHRMKPSPTALKPLLDALLEGRSSDPVMMSIATRLGSWSGFHGGATTTAPNTAGPVLSGSSAGQVGSARIPAYTSPLQCFLREKFLRCW